MITPLEEDFLNIVRLFQLESEPEPDDLIDFIMVNINSLLLESRYEEIDKILSTVSQDIGTYFIDTLLALLTITFTAKNKLPNRNDLYIATKITLLQRDVKDIDKILEGLG